MSLEEYLSSYYHPSTVRIYSFEIRHYLRWMGTAAAQGATYQQVMSYVQYLRSRYDKPTTVHRILQAIKTYYNYLQATGKRVDHPCSAIRLRDLGRADIQVQDLLTQQELERLLDRKERFAVYAIRNRMVLSLLVYQALLTKELVDLKVADIDLDQGTIYIRQTAKTNARRLSLQANQIMLIHQYLSQVRPRLVKVKTEALIITGRGTAERGEGISHLVKTMRSKVPDKKLTATTIRQSVIAQKLRSGQGLRQVQVFAGHRKVSSTERYRSNHLQELRQAIGKYHPLR